LMVRILLLLARILADEPCSEARSGLSIVFGAYQEVRSRKASVNLSVNSVCDRIPPSAWRLEGIVTSSLHRAEIARPDRPRCRLRLWEEKHASARVSTLLTGHPPPDAYAVSFRVRLWRQTSPKCCRARGQNGFTGAVAESAQRDTCRTHVVVRRSSYKHSVRRFQTEECMMKALSRTMKTNPHQDLINHAFGKFVAGAAQRRRP
ncbi:MAG: hypothetical protein JWQ22_1609, partial [Devosia sp.]|nr:hypothetical protein [Devosia sp.]